MRRTTLLVLAGGAAVHALPIPAPRTALTPAQIKSGCTPDLIPWRRECFLVENQDDPTEDPLLDVGCDWNEGAKLPYQCHIGDYTIPNPLKAMVDWIGGLIERRGHDPKRPGQTQTPVPTTTSIPTPTSPVPTSPVPTITTTPVPTSSPNPNPNPVPTTTTPPVPTSPLPTSPVPTTTTSPVPTSPVPTTTTSPVPTSPVPTSPPTTTTSPVPSPTKTKEPTSTPVPPTPTPTQDPNKNVTDMTDVMDTLRHVQKDITALKIGLGVGCK